MHHLRLLEVRSIFAHLVHHLLADNPPAQNPAPILRAPHHVQPQRMDPTRSAAKLALGHERTLRNDTDKPRDLTLVTYPDPPDG